MIQKRILLNILIVIIISFFDNSYEECVCNVRVRGEYCGTELNRRNGNSDCQPNHMYFCGDGNRNRVPKLLIQCKDVYECEQNQFSVTNRSRRRNPCLRGLKCRCPTGIGRGPHCGKNLIGDDCPPDMLFICRRSGPDSLDICADGCANGKCIIGVDGYNGERGRNTDTDSDDD